MATDVAPVVFFGTGPVAAKSLELLAKNFAIEAVITKPKPAHHRGNTPVLELSEKLDIKVLTANNKGELDDLFATSPVKSELAVLIDFGIIVSQNVIDYFPLGIINSHFSVLPDLRGADPLTFAILSGQEQTGVSLMKLVEAMDEGPLIGYGEFKLTKDITTPELTDELILLSDALLQHDLPRVFDGSAGQGAPQSITGRKVSYSRRLTKQDGIIDWAKPANIIEREIRAYSGWPGSRTTLAKKEVTVLKAHVEPGTGDIGKVVFTKDSLYVQTGEDRLFIESLKPAGKPTMDISAFLAGNSKNL